MSEKLPVNFVESKDEGEVPVAHAEALSESLRGHTEGMALDLSAPEAEIAKAKEEREQQRQESLQKLRAKFGVEGSNAEKVRPATEQVEASAKSDPMEVSTINEKTGVVRLPPSFYRKMLVLSSSQGDRETFNKFKKAVTAEEKIVIEKDALRQSEKHFRQFSEVVSSLDFEKGDLKALHDALEKPYSALSEAGSELHVIDLVCGSGSNRRGLLMKYLDKAHLLVSDLREACQGEAHRQQESMWVRMFSKDRSKIIALSKILKDYQQGIEKSYGAFSGGEDLDHETSARLLVPTWPRQGFESGK